MQIYHGAHTQYSLHIGQCYTDDYDSAENYAGGSTVTAIDIDMDGLIVTRIEGYDHDANEAPGDDGNGHGSDILIYDDEDEFAREHTTYRLMTQRAIDAASILSTEEAA